MKFGTEEQTVKQIQKRLVTLSSLWKIVLKENQRKEDCNMCKYCTCHVYAK